MNYWVDAKQARQAVAKMPEWKQDYRLTKFSLGFKGATMKLKQSPVGIEVWVNNDIHPFEEVFIGAIGQNDDDGRWVFIPADKTMTCKHLRLVAEKVGQLNMEIEG